MGMRNIFVRRAFLADLDLVAPLFDAYRQFYGQPGDLALGQDFLRERLGLDQSVIFLPFEAAGAAGFTQLYPNFSSASARRIYILNYLFVDPSVRRGGVGRCLLEAAAEFGRAQGAVRLALSTALTNAPAQALYEAAGWRRDEVFCNYNLTL